MNSRLEHLIDAHNAVLTLQRKNSELTEAAHEAVNQFPGLEIDAAFYNLQTIHRTFAKEMVEINEHLARTQAELEAANPVDDSDSDEDGFDGFIATCLAGIEDRDGIAGSGEVFTAHFSRHREDGSEQFVSVTIDAGHKSITSGENAPEYLD